MSFCRVGREPQAFGLCDVPRVREPESPLRLIHATATEVLMTPSSDVTRMIERHHRVINRGDESVMKTAERLKSQRCQHMKTSY